MYLLYNEYQNMGGALDETTFNDLEFEAESYIDWYTFNRLQNKEEYPERVKRCVYKLILFINTMQSISSVDTGDETNNVSIASESNDGVLTSYNVLSASEILENNKEQVASIIKRYLQGVTNSLGQNVLYRGLYPNE